MNLNQMRANIAEIAEFIATDKHGTVRSYCLRALVEVGIIDCLPFDPDTPAPFPRVADLTAMQMSLFDNWPEGKRAHGKPYRYAVTANGWTVPARAINFAKRNWQVKTNATLFTGKELAGKIPILTRSTLRHPISPSYAETLLQFAEAFADDDSALAGPLFTKGKEGTRYFDQTFVIMRLDAGKPTTGIIYSGGDQLDLAGFVTRDASGQRLKGNAAFQSRTASDALLTNWRSR